MKFLDVFNEVEKGNYALTDEAIYASLQNQDELIPLYGGNKEHTTTERQISVSAKTKNGDTITVFSGEGIIISLDGSAGCMTYKNGERFALNHHAGFITLKNGAEHVVNPEFFAIYLQKFYRNLSVSDGSKTLSLQQLYSEEFELPSYETQCRILTKLKEIHKKLLCLVTVKEEYLSVLEKEVSFKYQKFQAKNVAISTCIDYMSGNSGLTEEFIYQMLQRQNERYAVLSSATEERTMMGTIPLCLINNRQLKVFDNKEGLLVTRNGKAGQTRFLPKGKYTINDHAYILFQKDSSDYDINLKWLSLQYRAQFLQFASSSDNGTWNMTGFFKYTNIDIPSLTEQNRVVSVYAKAEKCVEYINNLERKYQELLSREIACA